MQSDDQASATAQTPSTPKPKTKYIKRKGPWVIADVAGKAEPKEGMKFTRLGEGKNPRVLHYALDSAAKEAIRLAELFPQGQFAIFECIGVVSQ